MGVDALDWSIESMTPEWWCELDWACDCGRQPNEMHSQTCAVTPIYAELVPSDMNMIIGSFHAVNFGITQTVIKCAECGRENIGKNLDIIKTSGPAYPEHKRIVKAVCPSHNRKGTVKWRHIGVTD